METRTYLVDGNTGEGTFKEQESGQIVPSFERSEGFHEEPRQEPAQDLAEGKFKEADLRQVEARFAGRVRPAVPVLPRVCGGIVVKAIVLRAQPVTVCRGYLRSEHVLRAQ